MVEFDHTSNVRRFAPIGPIAILEDLERYGELGDYHVLLAHDVLNFGNPLKYNRLFAMHDSFKILDNSVVELGMPLVNGILQAADTVNADCIVLPDVLRDSEATQDLIHMFVKDIGKAEMRQREWMLIPQGLNLEAIIDCAERIIDHYGEFIHYMGIPRWIANDLGSRFEITRWMSQRLNYYDLKGIHMMGMSKLLGDDIKSTTYFPGVMGIDSANPLVLGQNHRNIDDVTVFEHMDRGNYWKHDSITGTTLYNIRRIRQMLNKV